MTLFFLAKSTVDGYLFNWTEDVVPLISYFFYIFGVYVFASGCLLEVDADLT